MLPVYVTCCGQVKLKYETVEVAGRTWSFIDPNWDGWREKLFRGLLRPRNNNTASSVRWKQKQDDTALRTFGLQEDGCRYSLGDTHVVLSAVVRSCTGLIQRISRHIGCWDTNVEEVGDNEVYGDQSKEFFRTNLSESGSLWIASPFKRRNGGFFVVKFLPFILGEIIIWIGAKSMSSIFRFLIEVLWAKGKFFKPFNHVTCGNRTNAVGEIIFCFVAGDRGYCESSSLIVNTRWELIKYPINVLAYRGDMVLRYQEWLLLQMRLQLDYKIVVSFCIGRVASNVRVLIDGSGFINDGNQSPGICASRINEICNQDCSKNTLLSTRIPKFPRYDLTWTYSGIMLG
ncbi:hypothetical protein R1flu_000771 [Riccia fluitans]|uniref:Uncharacterized protein n=1 Tax=Riccia fluitans TaxID=41844 RepID=A0ABD1Y1R8_9MARC